MSNAAPPSTLEAIPSLETIKRRRLLLGCLMLVSFLLYANTLRNGFVSDDHQQIESNPYAHSFRYVGKIFTSTVWSFQGSEGLTNYYRPLMTFGYVLSDRLFQTHPLGFHLVNLFLNCAVVWLVCSLGLQVFGDFRIAFAAAVLFAFHPVHSEAVAWVAAITELQLAIFFLLTFCFFLRLGEVGADGRSYFLLSVAFTLALFSKEQAVVLPALATVYEHFYREDRARTAWQQKMRRYGSLWILTATYLLFRIVVLRGFAPVVQRPNLGVSELIWSAFALIGQYAAKLFWPNPLIAFYLFEKSGSPTEPRVLAGLVVVLACVGLFCLLWKYARAYSFWMLWIAFTLAPVLNVRWMAASAFAERYLYLPSVGLCFLLAGTAVWLWDHARIRFALRAASITVVIALLLLSLALIVRRNRAWHDDEKLILADLALQPRASYLRTNLGAIEWARKNKQAAVRQWETALADKPDNPIAMCNLGMAMIDENKWREAEDFLKKAIALRPRYASPHVYLGNLYAAEDRKNDAENEYRRAIEIFPLNPDVRNRLAKFYTEEGRTQEAEEQFRASVDAAPTLEGLSGLGDLLLRKGHHEEAAVAWQNAVKLSPFDEHVRLQLGQVYQAQGRHADAEEQYRVVLLLDPRNNVALAGMHEIKPAEFPKIHP